MEREVLAHAGKFKARFGLVAYDVLQRTDSPVHGIHPTIATVCLPGSELRQP